VSQIAPGALLPPSQASRRGIIASLVGHVARQDPARLLRFGIVGLSGVAVNLAVLHLLFGMLHWTAFLASALAVEVSVVSNFFWNNRWTFQQADVSPRRFVRFNLASLGGLAITSGVFTLLLGNTPLPYVAADLIAIAVATAWNFGASVLWTWST
jgi:dolichol-phosphate mannosyltransferase